MKRKLSVSIFFIILMIVFSVTVFGAGYGDLDSDSTSDSRLKIWDEYYPYKIIKDGKPLYLFDMQEKNIDNYTPFLLLDK